MSMTIFASMREYQLNYVESAYISDVIIVRDLATNTFDIVKNRHGKTMQNIHMSKLTSILWQTGDLWQTPLDVDALISRPDDQPRTISHDL